MMRKALCILLLVVAAGSFLYIGLWYVGGQRRQESDRAFAQRFHQALSVNEQSPPAASASASTNLAGPPSNLSPFATLYKEIPDFSGWITLPDSAIDYPVVQCEDNQRYLTANAFQAEDTHGAIFLDYRCLPGDGLMILYGHHMKDGTMFADVIRYRNSRYHQEHPTFLLYDAQGHLTHYQVTDNFRWDEQTATDTPFYEHMQALRDASGTDILCLATCDYTNGNAHFVVVAEREDVP